MRKKAIVFAVLVLALFLLKLTLSSKNQVICANSISCIKNLSVNVENDSVGTFLGQRIIPPKINLALDNQKKHVLGDSTATTGEKHVYIDLSTQTLFAYQGDTLFMQTLISSGKWHPTPTGDYKVWEKLRATRMTGGSGADFYDLPNVPYVMFFAGENASEGAGFSLHGAYWHDNFGHPMSHGCVNMRTVDAEKLYYWSDDPPNGLAVTIYDSLPSSFPTTAITSLPQTQNNMISQESADGSEVLTMRKQVNTDGSTAYYFYVDNNLVFARTLTNGETMSIPFNAWSPDNKNVFVKESNGDYFVISSAVSTDLNSISDVNPVTFFNNKYPSYKLTDITGWAAPTLLVLNINNDASTPISMWFDIQSKSFIPLAVRFN